MLFDKRELRELCIHKGKEHYIRYIERYLSLTAQEKIDLWEKATIHNLLKEPLFSEEETLFQRLIRKIKNMMPWKITEQRWYAAFLFFNDHEEKEMNRIYQRMGLPKNGIRPDDC